MSRVSNKVKGLLLKSSGLFTTASREARKLIPGDARIMLYHGVDKHGELKYNTKFTSIQTLRQQLLWFKKNTNVISLDDYFDGKLNPKKFNIAITFDDGFANNHRYLLPLMEELKVPATIFVTTIGVHHQNFLWPDAIDLMRFEGPKRLIIDGETYSKGRKQHYVNSNGQHLKAIAKSKSLAFKQEILDQLKASEENLKKFDETYWRMLNQKELLDLSNSKYITLGTHGTYHNCFHVLSDSETEKALANSKAFIENCTQKEVKAVAFPDGLYTRESIDTAERLGYSQMLAVDFLFDEDRTDSRIAERLGINPYISWQTQINVIRKGRY